MTTHFVGFFAPLTRFDAVVPPSYSLLPVEQRHLTLVYLGPLGDPSAICSRLATLKLRRFAVRFRGLQAFPSPSKPRYLAAVPERESRALLEELRAKLSTVLAASADRYEEFRPHVSIAHTREKASLELLKAVQRAVRASGSIVEELTVDRLCLMAAERGTIRALCCVNLD